MKRVHLVIAGSMAITAAVAALSWPRAAVAPAGGEPVPTRSFELPDVLASAPTGAGGGGDGAPAVDTSYLWAAFEAGDYRSVREELRVLARLHPEWTPPSDLLRLTDAMQSRAVVLPAVADGAFADAVAYYETHRDRFACADVTIEALWAVAEAYAARERADDAFAVYQRVLDECDETDLRLATLEKAIAREDRERFEALLEVEEERSHDAAELERLARIRQDGLGGAPSGPVRLSRLDRTLEAVGAGRAEAEDLAWLADHARAERNANAAMVLGYHHLDGDRPERAADWFERSLDWRRNRKALEGLYHAYGRLGRADAQRRLAARHPEALADLARSDGAADTRLAEAWRALEAGDAERALLHAELAGAEVATDERELVRGWALLEQDRPGEAEAAFTRAAQTAAPDAQLRAEKGRALALIAAGRDDEVVVSPSLPAADAADIERARLERRIVETLDAGDPERAHALLRERQERFPGAPSLGTLEGWILYEMGELYAADRFFTELWIETRDDDARFALMTVREAMYPNR
ncbi:MAG: hypothetical protein ACLFTG_15240 [Alphaproteobacteria bacterium]